MIVILVGRTAPSDVGRCAHHLARRIQAVMIGLETAWRELISANRH
jgi:hypothetical protein